MSAAIVLALVGLVGAFALMHSASRTDTWPKGRE
jgi:hypothetical protein